DAEPEQRRGHSQVADAIERVQRGVEVPEKASGQRVDRERAKDRLARDKTSALDRLAAKTGFGADPRRRRLGRANQPKHSRRYKKSQRVDDERQRRARNLDQRPTNPGRGDLGERAADAELAVRLE